MGAEQEKYYDQLLAMPPEEILNKAREYAAREDILAALVCWNLPEELAMALLKSPSPLADVVREYCDQDVDNNRIIDALEGAAKIHIEPPIYRQTVQYAMEHGECDAYFASQKAYKECRAAIDESITRNFDGMYLGENCVSEVMRKFSPERVRDVLACTIQQKEWDGRFSRCNRTWANEIDTSHMEEEPYGFTAVSHPAVLDGFISMFRKEVLEQSQSEKSAEKTQHKPAERSDNLEL